jgi:hypothetical protein
MSLNVTLNVYCLAGLLKQQEHKHTRKVVRQLHANQLNLLRLTGYVMHQQFNIQ